MVSVLKKYGSVGAGDFGLHERQKSILGQGGQESSIEVMGAEDGSYW